MGKSASVSSAAGRSTLTVTFDYPNAKFNTMAIEMFEAFNIDSSVYGAWTNQQKADWLMDNILLYGWRKFHSQQAQRIAVAVIAPLDFDSDNGA